MMQERPLILALNCGSSSIKFAVFASDHLDRDREALWAGSIEGIGSRTPTIRLGAGTPEALSAETTESHRLALDLVRQRADAWLAGRALAAIVHRVVHGGGRYTTPVVIDAAVLADLERFVPLAPLHQPFALDGIRVFQAERPGTVQVACFDTAFHHTLSPVETMFALPRADWENGIRRYGFHGLSYEFVAQAIHQRHGDVVLGKTIVAHLGSGASLCAMLDLRSVATTMGFSALDGLMMGTRCGALDPGVILYLMETKNHSVERMSTLLYHESGLLGVSGLSADPRVLLEREHEVPAAQALALYVRMIVREMCSLASAIGGLDMLVFTAGIGEHNAAIRERVCAQLAFLGVALDAGANAAHASTISSMDSRVLVAVEPTNEEWLTARAARNVLDA